MLLSSNVCSMHTYKGPSQLDDHWSCICRPGLTEENRISMDPHMSCLTLVEDQSVVMVNLLLHIDLSTDCVTELRPGHHPWETYYDSVVDELHP